VRQVRIGVEVRGKDGGMTRPNRCLLALAIGAFCIGTTEFAPMGLLPVIAHGVGVSIPAAGLLISAYAVGVMVGAPVMTLALAGLSRDRALVALMAIFTLGNLFSALAGNYEVLLLARLVTSLCHGAFFGIGSVVAMNAAPPAKRSAAVALMFTGLTIANVGGVPAAAWLGQEIGWRSTFAAMAGLGLVAMLACFIAIPHEDAGARPDVRAELRVLGRADVVWALLATVFGAGSMFTLYTYIAPVLENGSGVSPGALTAILALIGLGFTVGNAAGGYWVDRAPMGTTITLFGLLALTMALLGAFLHSRPATIGLILIWSVAAFAIVPPLQVRAIRAAHGAPGLASSMNIGAFNLGNALGAAIGGGVIAAGAGFWAVPTAGAAVALAGLAIVLIGARTSSPSP
jgi:DHA1 family inner membrane transport protein